jgi:hypothetical protein
VFQKLRAAFFSHLAVGLKKCEQAGSKNCGGGHFGASQGFRVAEFSTRRFFAYYLEAEKSREGLLAEKIAGPGKNPCK